MTRDQLKDTYPTRGPQGLAVATFVKFLMTSDASYEYFHVNKTGACLPDGIVCVQQLRRLGDDMWDWWPVAENDMKSFRRQVYLCRYKRFIKQELTLEEA